MTIIKDYNAISESKWKDFVAKHPNGNVFYIPEMFEAYQQSKDFEPVFICLLNDSLEILGLLTAVIQRESSKIYGMLTSRAIIYGEPLILDNNSKVLEEILTEYKKTFGRKVIYTQIRNFNISKNFKEIYSKLGFVFEDHLNIVLDLQNNPDLVWKDFSKSRKKGIKKAENENFVFTVQENGLHLDSFYQLLSISYQRIKLPYPSIDHFNSIVKNSDQSHYQIFTIEKDSTIVVALFAMIHNNTMYGYYMGSTDNGDIIKLKPIDLLFWKVFNWCIQNKIQYFDWMGAGKPDKDYGVRDFKLQFGGELQNMGRYEIIHKPLLYKIGKLGLWLYKKLK